MGIIAPPSTGVEKKIKTDKGFLKDALLSCMKDIVQTDDGRQLTAAQAGAERLTKIWLYAESNTDSIAAGKLIFERLYGKAAVEKVDEQREMPRLIFALKDKELEELNNVIADETGDKSDYEAGILIQKDNGEELIV